MKSVADFPQEALSWLALRSDAWPIYPLKRVVESNKLALPDSTEPDYELKYVDISSVELSEGIKKTEELTFENAPSRARRIVRSGDVLVSTVRTYLRAIARVEDAPENLIASTGFAVLSPQEQLDSSYFGLFCTSHPFVEAIVAQSTGASYPATNASDIVRLPIPVPPLDLQRKIAAFVERKIKEIDDLIAKKRGLLGLLAEKRSALITRAVTKGLDPTAPMKPSGIDWLGDIPAHWEARRFYQTFRMKSGAGITALEMSPDGAYPVYGGNGIRGAADSYTHDGEYVLVGRQGALCGNVHVASGQFWASEHALVIYPTIQLDIGWLKAVLEAMNLRQYSVATAQPGLSVDNLSLLKLPVPSHKEQASISALISKEDAEIRKSEALIQQAIDQLTEYRAAIITKAVTGKLEVT